MDPLAMVPVGRQTCLIVSPCDDGSVMDNTEYAFELCSEAITRGYAPFPLQQLYSQFMQLNRAGEETLLESCIKAWLPFCTQVWFCTKPSQPMPSSMISTYLAARRLDRSCLRVYYNGRNFSWYPLISFSVEVPAPTGP